MPIATLLLREPSTTSLTTVVEKSQIRKPPLPEYDLRLNSCQLDLILKSYPERFIKSCSSDEGFESDIDSLSIVSSDDSFTSANSAETVAKSQETDSANGSASSDSDTELPTAKGVLSVGSKHESYHLVDCICYTDVKCPKLLVFVIKNEALVFQFNNLENLQNFYGNFSALKAVTNQKAYSKNFGAKFNLVQRVDSNGITHIEIAKQTETRLYFPELFQPSNIISINTPERNLENNLLKTKVDIGHNLPTNSHNSLRLQKRTHNSLTLNQAKESRSNCKDANLRQRSESSIVNETRFNTSQNNSSEHNIKISHNLCLDGSNYNKKAASTDNLLELNLPLREWTEIPRSKNENRLRKVWNSAEDLLSTPKRPQRVRKLKGRAPAPPVGGSSKENIVAVQYISNNTVWKTLPQKETRGWNLFQPKSNILSNNPKLSSYQQFKYSDPKKTQENVVPQTSVPRRNFFKSDSSWTNSVPRLFKPRSQSESRNFIPMAYRYIDTTQTQYDYGQNSMYTHFSSKSPNATLISDRLFGMSSKLRNFESAHLNNNRYSDSKEDLGRNTLAEISYGINNPDGSLKSVIKKDDNKKKSNEKKVTFSAYTTVQVV